MYRRDDVKTLIRKIGRAGSGPGEFKNIRHMLAYNGELIICDTGLHHQPVHWNLFLTSR
jgi:hypothetical protein